MGKLASILSFVILFSFEMVFSQETDSIRKYSLKFQLTSIYQYQPAFHSPYSGTNSLIPTEEKALSLTSTLFLDVPLWKGATATFNPEMSGGEGLSQAKGLGGFPNGETFRIGDTKPVVYVARMLLQQEFQFKNNKSLQLVFGKFGLSDYFDGNTYSHDPRTQFLNWSLMANGAWDYAANTRGYTVGFYGNYQFDTWQIRTALVAEPTYANGPNVAFSFKDSNALNIEIEKKITFKNNYTSIIKILGFRNTAGMGNYNEANANFITTPDIKTTRENGRTKYGIGLNADYSHGDYWGLFARMSFNDGKNETWAFTEIDRSASIGINLKGKMWNRKDDFAGVAIVANGLSKSHEEYQKLGGNGFMIGDGTLNYGTEKIAEVFYSFLIPKTHFTISPDYQFAINPAYNKDRGPVQFLALRFHTEF
ncbi:carbohydrate porin [Flavobacterium sp. MC2016-06]|uniref:carbohydrate porin n=1 Tax=Flavobacterium sp. MC2016-06 TaxID=2676308 RepID=UPI001C0BA668|nr:carbohydrate porin [Flavobacterium sp. MC2016-06]MBU3862252.1 carbohydrate porin [Flavobacterium sp. MC2016-06]